MHVQVIFVFLVLQNKHELIRYFCNFSDSTQKNHGVLNSHAVLSNTSLLQKAKLLI